MILSFVLLASIKYETLTRFVKSLIDLLLNDALN
jgi:hypothetical protein